MSRKSVALVGLAAAAATLAMVHPAAASTAGSGMPWENGLMMFTNSLRGPVAFAVSLAGVVASGAGLIWGGELGHFAKTGINITLAVSLILLASNVLMNLTGVGATF
ncbi:MAG: TrbC/VirB2 family protein [Magnetospirillum sp.]|nr:TrbC/VirB2 family protein [Magnetospirillum sp.]